MRNFLVVSLFMLATLVWAAAQQPGAMPQGTGGQATSPGAQTPGAQPPDASQSQGSMPGSAGQQGASGAQGAAQSPAASGPVTEGCLGGSNPNYTITDKAGTTYKLNLPANADASPLASHVGESVQVQGAVNSGAANNASIDVSKIGRGTGKCPGSSSGAQAPPQ